MCPGSGAGRPSIGDDDKRDGARQPVLKGAKLRLGDSVVDCLVLDLTGRGARISVETAMPFPPEVTLELRSGGMWRAAPRWQRGNETGLEFLGFAGLGQQAATDASVLRGRLRNCAVHDVLLELGKARYFDHPELESAALRAREAVAALESALERSGA